MGTIMNFNNTGFKFILFQVRIYHLLVSFHYELCFDHFINNINKTRLNLTGWKKMYQVNIEPKTL